MKKIVFLFSLLFSTTIFSQEWKTIEIGQCPTPNSYDLVLADGKNDGKQRIYVTTKDGGVYEWSFENNAWSLNDVVHPGPLDNLMHIAAGDARNDGTVSIYFAEWHQAGRIFEATWNGSAWQKNVIGVAPEVNTGVVVGDGRNEGRNRLYVSGSYGLHEWNWDGNSWNHTPINSAYHEVSGDIGDARNDGVQRVMMNTDCPQELTWAGTSFDQVNLLCPTNTYPDAVQIADGRNDGIQRVYVNTTAGGDTLDGRWEYTWVGTGWVSELIEDEEHRGDIHLAKLKSDGKNRVYTTTSDYWAGPADDLVEYEWDGSSWVKTGVVLDAISGATAMLASGNGRNDDTLRMYTPNYVTGGIYEITHVDPYFQGTTSSNDYSKNTDVNIFPNPSYGEQLNININSTINLGFLNFELVDYLGKIIWQEKLAVNNENLNHTIQCNQCKSGIYFLKINGEKNQLISKKIIRF